MTKLFQKVLLSIATFASINLVATDVEIPNWHEVVEPLKVAAASLGETLNSDLALYQEINPRMEAAVTGLNTRVAERARVMSCIKAQFEKYKANLQQCGEDTEALKALISEEKLDLTGQLDALRLSTTREIAALTSKRDQLLEDLDYIEDLKKQVEGEHGAVAAEVMAIFKAMTERYELMIGQKELFLNNIDILSDEILEESSKAQLELSEISTQLCD